MVNKVHLLVHFMIDSLENPETKRFSKKTMYFESPIPHCREVVRIQCLCGFWRFSFVFEKGFTWFTFILRYASTLSSGSGLGSGTTSLDGVKTGDEFPMAGWLAMAVIAAGALAVLLAERDKGRFSVSRGNNK